METSFKSKCFLFHERLRLVERRSGPQQTGVLGPDYRRSASCDRQTPSFSFTLGASVKIAVRVGPRSYTLLPVVPDAVFLPGPGSTRRRCDACSSKCQHGFRKSFPLGVPSFLCAQPFAHNQMTPRPRVSADGRPAPGRCCGTAAQAKGAYSIFHPAVGRDS